MKGGAREMPPPGTRARGQPAGPQRPPAEPAAAEQSGPGCAEGASQQALRHAVTATCWLDPGDSGQPGPVSVRFTGRRTGVSGRPRQGDRFERVETIDRVVPCGGPVSVTAKVPDVTPGEWIIWARPAGGPATGGLTLLPGPPPGRRLGLRRVPGGQGEPGARGDTRTQHPHPPRAVAHRAR